MRVVLFLKNCFFHQSSTFEVHLVLVLNMLLVSGLLMCLTRNRSTCPELRLVWKKQLLHLWPNTHDKKSKSCIWISLTISVPLLTYCQFWYLNSSYFHRWYFSDKNETLDFHVLSRIFLGILFCCLMSEKVVFRFGQI